jgi:hemolysin activation/secretion protein
MMRQLAVFGLWTAALSSAADAQIAASVLPGREQQRFATPPAPLSRPAGPLIQLRSEAAPEAAAQIELKLNAVVVEGSTVYQAADLEPLYADLVGHEVSAADVYAIASKISAKYGHDGYLVAKVFVVPQAVSAKGATIRLRVVEGYIERVDWPEGAKRYRDLWSPCLTKIVAERPARTRTIERCLLLANDIPGLTFSSSIKAGAENTGAAVLVVEMNEKPFDAAVRVDNRGALGEGPWEQTTSLTENNRLGLDESFNLTWASAIPWYELQYIGGNWHQVLTADGLALDVNVNFSNSVPGITDLETLDFKGRSVNAETGFTYPLIRAREQNLRVSALVFDENATSYSLGETFSDDRLRGFRLRANFDETDSALRTVGLTQLIATFSQGIEGLGSTANGNPLASVADGRVDFSKFEATLNRTQALIAGFSAYGALYGQTTGIPLLSAEQCSYGGQVFGRAYYAQEFSGDRCLFAVGELRYDAAIPNNPLTQTQFYAFVDRGDLWRVAPVASSVSFVTASSAGAGVRLAWKENFSADLQAARAVASPVGEGWRIFAVLTARY